MQKLFTYFTKEKGNPDSISGVNLRSDQLGIDMPSVSHNQPQALPSNLPQEAVVRGTREVNNEIRLLLHKETISGNWEAAIDILEKHPSLVFSSTTDSNETILHIAVLGNSLKIVNHLMGKMTKEQLKLSNNNGETALSIAAITGNVEIAEILVKKNDNLPHIHDSKGNTPLYMAALHRKHKMVKFLYEISKNTPDDFWTDESRGLVLVKCVEANLFDIAADIVKERPRLAKSGSLLGLLARKPEAFYVTRPGIIVGVIRSLCQPKKIEFPDTKSDAFHLLRTILEEIGKLPKNELNDIIRGPPDEIKEDEKHAFYEKESQEALQLLRTISDNIAKLPAKVYSLFKSSTDENTTTLNDSKQKYSSRVLFLAAEIGNTAFVEEVLHQYPYLGLDVNDSNQSIFHVAVSHGHGDIYRLLFTIGSISDMILSLEDDKGNNMLHLVGPKAKDNTVENIRGVSLRLNPDISRFKEIEDIIPPHLLKKKNAAGLTPHKAFIKNHKDLFSKGEEWMKEISTQLMVVAALVATASYQVAFQYLGEDSEVSGTASLQNQPLFKAFIIFDSLSFISSTTSILMVLSILGSNYEEYDFMISLSKQLVICLAFVFISILSMILTFLINFFLFYPHQRGWELLLINIIATTPFLIFSLSKNRLPGRFIHGLKMIYKTNVSGKKFY